ncbi:MAG: uL30 family ribosomal protein [Rickettsiales bacterium]|jgi:ribosomal protein L30|nr:uL30 family ribosomal protein [Rickettsiales bacterium]
MTQRLRLQKFEELADKVVLVERTGGESGRTQRQKDTLKGLGLRNRGAKSEIRCTRDIYGMLLKVSHMIRVIYRDCI